MSRAYWIFFIALSACTHHTPHAGDLSHAQSLWNNIKASNYDYTVRQRCYCLEAYSKPMRVKVREGKVVSASYSQDKSPVPQKIVKSLRTIDEWFGYIQRGYARNYATLIVHYDKDKGYPKNIITDPHERISDDEKEITISDLLNVQ